MKTLTITNGQNDYRCQTKATTPAGYRRVAKKRWPYANPYRLKIRVYFDDPNKMPWEDDIYFK